MFTKDQLLSIRQLCNLAFSVSLPQGVGGIKGAREIVAIDDICAAEIEKGEAPQANTP